MKSSSFYAELFLDGLSITGIIDKYNIHFQAYPHVHTHSYTGIPPHTYRHIHIIVCIYVHQNTHTHTFVNTNIQKVYRMYFKILNDGLGLEKTILELKPLPI